MSFLELAKERYSVRKFKEIMPEEEKIEKILEAALYAPTACNFQPQKIYVVKSQDKREKLASVTPCTFNAPIVMVVGYDKNIAAPNKLTPGYDFGEIDASIVGTHIMMEAWEQGIGSCWVGWFDAETVRKTLELPESFKVTALFPMGYADDAYVPAPAHSESRNIKEIVTEL